MSPQDPYTSPFAAPASVAAGQTVIGQMASGASSSPGFSDPPPEGPYAFLEPPQHPGDIGMLGHYRVLRRVGVGGMGFVFEAQDSHLARTVALKVMRPELAANLGYRQRFLLEARAAASITSDNIVTVYQVGVTGEVPFLAMQYLHGESLQQRLQKSAPLPVGVALTVARDTASGLAAAHARGMIHRDIKPANLWLDTDKPDGPFRRVKILDFGLARPDDRDTRLTASGVIVGTPHYMAPEQASGEKVDARADLFSLGCVMYAMLVGELAFDGPNTMAVLMALANHTPPRVSSRNFEVPEELADLVAELLAKPRDQRPASAEIVASRLDAMLAEMSGFLPASMLVMGPDGLPALPNTPSGQPNPMSPMFIRQTGNVGLGSTKRPIPDGVATASFGPTTRPTVTPVPAGLPPIPPTTATGPLASPSSLPPPVEHEARNWRAIALGTAGISIIVSVLAFFGLRNGDAGVPPVSTEPIHVGVLHSDTGPMAISEKPVKEATHLAIEEINAAGGVLGRPLKAVFADGRSEPEVFASEATKLIKNEKAVAIFGCWTSASRKAVREVVQQHDVPLFYPVQFEGLEESPRIVYLGPTANQQLMPALDFLTDQLQAKKIFLVGSNYVFPVAANEIVKDLIKSKPGVSIVGEVYLPMNDPDIAAVIKQLREKKPDAILNTINGSSNFQFYDTLDSDPTVTDIPILSLSVTEPEILTFGAKASTGDYLAETFFMSLDPDGKGPAAAFRKKMGDHFGADRGRAFSDPQAAAYSGVHLWAKAVNAAGTTDTSKVLAAVRGSSFTGPAGDVKIDPDTQYTWQPMRIGKILPTGKIEVVAGTATPLKPIPFPATRTPEEWDRFLRRLNVKWHGQWAAPEKK